MSSRQGDWHLVDRDADPVPATSSDVDTVAREMRSRATAAQDVRDVLQSLADLDGWRGQTAEAFGDKAGEVLDDLGKVVDRYEAVATALYSWGDEVGQARTATWSALQDAEAAQQTIGNNPEATAPAGEELSDAEDAANTRRGDAQDDLAAAKSALEGAMGDLDDAANRARGDIEDAADIWDDGFWGDVAGWVRDNADAIDAIVTALEALAIVIAVVFIAVIVFFTAPAWLVAGLFAAGVALSMLVFGGTLALAAQHRPLVASAASGRLRPLGLRDRPRRGHGGSRSARRACRRHRRHRFVKEPKASSVDSVER